MQRGRVNGSMEGAIGDENVKLCAISADDIQGSLVRCDIVKTAKKLSEREAKAAHLDVKRHEGKRCYVPDTNLDWDLFVSFENLSLNTTFY